MTQQSQNGPKTRKMAWKTIQKCKDDLENEETLLQKWSKIDKMVKLSFTSHWL